MQKVDFDVLTQKYETVQIYGPEDEDELFEVRLPKFDETPTLLHGFGPTVNQAALEAVEKIKEATEDPLPEGLVVVPKKESEEVDDSELYVAAPNGSGKFHVFRPGESISLCGKVELEGEEELTPISESDVTIDEVCRNCAKQAPNESLQLKEDKSD